MTLTRLTDPAVLRAELMQHGRSQSALGRFMGLDPAIINRMCNGSRQIKLGEAALIQAYLDSTGPAIESPQSTQLIKVAGAVEAGAWRDMALVEYDMTIPVVRQPDVEDMFALKVVGSSMNLRYPDGSFVIARRWDGGHFPIGKTVVVQRTDTSGKIETTLKELVQGPAGLELWPRSSDPRHQTPIPYDNDDSTVQIIGRVFASYRDES